MCNREYNNEKRAISKASKKKRDFRKGFKNLKIKRRVS